jgi:Xaa-Pro aminopeptidase
MEGSVLSADDPDLVKRMTGVDGVYGTDILGEHLARLGWTGRAKVIFTPFQPAEGAAMSRDLAVRVTADHMSDPFDGRPSRVGMLMGKLRDRFPMFTIQDLSPTLDMLRSIKSEREIALITRATRLSGLAMMEAMRSTEPGVYEYEIDGASKFIFFRNGAQGEAYYSLVASGPNALIGHYHAGRRKMERGDLLLFDFAPDVGYYMSDLTRMIPVGGSFTSGQKELYSFYLLCYKAILDAIRPGVTANVVYADAVPVMEEALRRSEFSKDLYREACERFVENFRRRSGRYGGSLGHWTGMATHDVGPSDVTYTPGMVFTIEPSLRVPEENINIRLEDLIVITETGRDVVSDFVPLEIEDIERLMKEEGILQMYPMDR